MSTFTKRVGGYYEHVQTEPATTWTIKHGLKDHPIADAYVIYEGDLQRIIPSAITYVDLDTCILTFSVPQSGFATVV